MDRFIAVGLQVIARDYLLSDIGWNISKKKAYDDALQAEVSSPWSSTVTSADTLSQDIRGLVELDKSFVPGTPFRAKAYRWRFYGTVLLYPSKLDRGALTLRSVINIDLEAHNAYADARYTRSITHLSSGALAKFRDGLTSKLLATYIAAMKDQGIIINGTSKQQKAENEKLLEKYKNATDVK
jgi:hypothetical protein